jgi:hypothetical protein
MAGERPGMAVCGVLEDSDARQHQAPWDVISRGETDIPGSDDLQAVVQLDLIYVREARASS